MDGVDVGCAVGTVDGLCEGCAVGSTVGDAVGQRVGVREGTGVPALQAAAKVLIIFCIGDATVDSSGDAIQLVSTPVQSALHDATLTPSW